jgi:polyferredoxin
VSSEAKPRVDAAVPRWVLWALAVLAASLALGGLGHWVAKASWLAGPGGVLFGLLCGPGFLLSLGAGLVGWAAWASRHRPFAERWLYVEPGGLVLAGAAGAFSLALERTGYLLASAFLVVWFTYLLQYVYRHKQLDVPTMRYVRESAIVATVAAAGWLLWALDGSPLLWAASAFVAAGVLARALVPDRAAVVSEWVPWLLRPGWATQLLLFTFLAEFFVGALLDLEVAGRGFLRYIPFYPIAGALGPRVALGAYDGLWFGAAILASAWFLVAIGVTMGGLLVLRMREVHVPAQRYRMGLTLAVFALAAIYIPSLASSTPLVSSRLLASLPVIGWGFGLRAGGPFEAGVFLAVLVMYATVGVLTVLFGRKALCSVMCGAALMYQGSTMHAMREFNQSSRVGRYLLGSRLSTAYVVASTLALTSLFVVSLLAYLHRLPTVQVASGQYDTSALPLPIELYFGGLWFAMFVSTPYIGTYNCATTGVCHWGSLSVPFAKVSFFRLRVRDREVCQRCTTFDCAKACPVGLVDMPLYFRTKGEYRSTKCCGVGDCVGACPYGNLYHQDVRSRIAALFARGSRPRPGSALPMVHASAPADPAPATAPGTGAHGLP